MSVQPASAVVAPPPGGGRRTRALTLPAFAAMAVIAVWPLRRSLSGGVLYYRDIHLAWHPQIEAFVQAVGAGSWPLWDPGPGFGRPLLADPSAMVAYPLTWLNLLLPAWLYYTVFAVAHLLWTAVGLYLLARRWHASPAAAVAGAAIWVSSGPVLSLVVLWHHLASACWLPWVFLAAERALLSRGRREAALFGLASAAQILAGSADVVAMTHLALAAYVLAFRVRWARLRWRRNARTVGVAASALALAGGLSAVQWMASLEVARRSQRWNLSETTRPYWSVHPLSLPGSILRLWDDVPISPALRARLYESREPFLASLYLGVAALPLAGAALARARRRSRFLAVTALVGVLVSLGRHAPFYSIAIALVPPLRILRYPVKTWVLVAFAWSLLCASGLDAWRCGAGLPPRRWRAWVVYPVAAAGLLGLAAAAAVRFAPVAVHDLVLHPDLTPGEIEPALAPVAGRLLAGGALALVLAVLAAIRLSARPQRLRAIAAAVGVLAVGDLALAHSSLNVVAPRALYNRPPVVDLLRRLGARRIYVYDYSTLLPPPRGRAEARISPALARQPVGWSEGASYALAQQMALTPSTAARWRLDTGFEPDPRRLSSREPTELTLTLRNFEGTPLHLRLLRLGAITHVVALHDEPFQDLRPVGVLAGLFDRDIRVFEVAHPLPPAYAVAGARAATGDAALAALLHPSFDVEGEIVLPGETAAAAAGPAGDVRVTERRPDRLALEARLERDGYVVVPDAYDPAWRVQVDGQPARLLRANAAFRAVRVAAGHHRIDMRYRPRGAVLGFAVTMASWVAAGLLLGRRTAGARSR